MLWLLAVLTAVAGLYLFLTAPGLFFRLRRKERIPFVPFAHRGLHSAELPENSLAAFRRAAERGFGIELDVQQTKDGELAVLHDATLERMCADQRKLAQVTLTEASRLRLLETGETIPSLRQVLDAVSPFRVPLLIEMKSDRHSWKTLPAKVMECMRPYPGFWCVESFDPRMVRWFKKHAPQVIRGQLAYDPAKIGEHRGEILYKLGACLLFNFLSRPDFIAYGHLTDRNLSFRLIRRIYHPVLAAWTVTAKEDYEQLRKRYDIMIFEQFDPDPAIDPKEEKGEQAT